MPHWNRALRRACLAVACCAGLTFVPARPAEADIIPTPRWELLTDGSVSAAQESDGVVYVGGRFTRIARRLPGNGLGHLFLDSATGEPLAGCAHITGDPEFLQYANAVPDPAGGLFLVSYANLTVADANGPYPVPAGFVRIGPDCRIDRTFALRDGHIPGNPWQQPREIVRGRQGVWVSSDNTGAHVALFSATTGRRLFARTLSGFGIFALRGEWADGRLLFEGSVGSAGTRIRGLLDPYSGAIEPFGGFAGSASAQYADSFAFLWEEGVPMVVVDLAAGAQRPGWSGPAFNSVSDVEIVGDRAFVSGVANGVAGVYALSMMDGAPVAWPVTLTPSYVMPILATNGTTLYMAHRDLREVSGVTRFQAAAVDPLTGAVTAWTNTRFLGADVGSFAAVAVGLLAPVVSDVPVERTNVAAVDLLTGAPTAWDPNAGDPVASSREVTAIGASATDVYMAALGTVWRAPVAGGAAGYLGQVVLQNAAGPEITSLAVIGSAVYAGGRFSGAFGPTGPSFARNNVAAFDQATGAVLPWNPNASARVAAMLPAAGRLFIGGSFSLIGGLPRSGLAVVDLGAGLVEPLDVGPQTGTSISGLASDGSALYFRGNDEVARVDPAGTGRVVWRYRGVLPPGGPLAVVDGKVFAAEELDAATGVPARTPGLETLIWSAYPAPGGVIWRGGFGLSFFEVAPAAPPAPPTDLSAVAVGRDVRVAWTGPASVFTSHVLLAGSVPGAANIGAFPLVGRRTFLLTTAPDGVYYVRVQAQNAFGLSAPSNEFRLVVGTPPCVAPPSAPPALTVTVTGLQASFSWPAAPGAASYVLEAGASPGSASLASLNVGAATGFSATASAGTYYVRVRGVNACGAGAPSPEATVVLSPVALPGVPGTPSVSVSGRTVTLNWSVPSTGGAPTGFLLEAGSAPGLANLATLPVTGTSLSTTAPPGTYFVRVRAGNAAGLGPPSADVRIDVP
jgi:hypothetical protein